MRNYHGSPLFLKRQREHFRKKHEEESMHKEFCSELDIYVTKCPASIPSSRYCLECPLFPKELRRQKENRGSR